MDDGRQQACQQWAAALRGSASGGTLGPSVRSEDMWQEVVQGTYLVRVVSAVCRAAVSARRYGSAFYEEMPVIAQVSSSYGRSARGPPYISPFANLLASRGSDARCRGLDPSLQEVRCPRPMSAASRARELETATAPTGERSRVTSPGEPPQDGLSAWTRRAMVGA